MQLHVLSPFTYTMSMKLYLFIFFLVLKESFCLDQYYEACTPQQCPDALKLTFPFYIRGTNRSFCGYRDFGLDCDQSGSSFTRIFGNTHVVKDIDYNNRSMRLVNVQSIPCPSALKNMTFDRNKFRLNSVSTHELVFLSNCSNKFPKNLTRYRIGSCGPAVQLVMLMNDGNLAMGKEVCGEAVAAPVEVNDEERNEVVDGGNYAEVMMRGFTMSWFAPSCDDCWLTGGRCGSDVFFNVFRCYCPDGPVNGSCLNETFAESPGKSSNGMPGEDTGRNKKTLVIVIVVSAGVGIVLVVIVLCFIKKLKLRRKTNSHLKVENFLKNHEFLGPKRYSYSQVRKMTNSFEIKLGQGGFGSVYKGVLSNGDHVAVKVLSEIKGNGEDFTNEVASIGRTSHVNIISLVGVCFEGSQRALVYEFMPNGSLEKFIHDQSFPSNNQLGWKILHQIFIGIARGLEYLYNGCNARILHFDIKPHNILLDKDLCPKISDFGLAKLFPEERSMISISHMRGTPGYIAPELFSKNIGHASHKTDVYSYGMMILEMVGRRKNIEIEVDHTSEIYFPHWIYKEIELHEELGLHGIVSEEENMIIRRMIIVGLWCIQTNPMNRPTITKVMEMLDEDLELLEIPPKPYLFSPSGPIGSLSTN